MKQSRWGTLSKHERITIHHALRVYLLHPLTVLDSTDAVTARNLADEIWKEIEGE